MNGGGTAAVSRTLVAAGNHRVQFGAGDVRTVPRGLCEQVATSA